MTNKYILGQGQPETVTSTDCAPIVQDPITGNIYGPFGPVTSSWRLVDLPASDVSGTNPASPAAINSALQAMSASGGGALLFPVSPRIWYFDDEIVMASNTSILLSPGVVISSPDPFTLTCTTVSGSKNVTVVIGTTSRLKSGANSAQIVVGTGIAINTTVESITGSSSFTLSNAATASGTVVLTFHAGHNVIRRQNVTNTRIMAPWGRATIDRNGLSAPLTATQSDNVRNCIRTVDCIDAETSGLLLTRAFFHGEIGVNNCGRINLEDIQTYQNGYRGLHYHGDSPTYSITDFTADKIESLEDGQIAFQISGNDWNTGIFICFDSCKRYQVGRVRARRIPGIGVHLNGNIVGGTKSSQISYDSVITEDVFIGVGLFNGLKQARFGSIQAKGTVTQISNVTLGSGTSQLPRYNSSGVPIPGATMMSMTLPVGTDMTQFYRGMVVLLQDVAAIRNSARRIWSVDATARTINVFADDNGASRAWDISLDGTTTVVTFGGMRQGVFFSTSSDSTQLMQDLSIDSIQVEGAMQRPIAFNTFGAGVYVAENIRIGSVHARDSVAGSQFANIQSLTIGSYQSRNTADRRTGNDTSSVDLEINRCDRVHISSIDLRSTGTGSTTKTNAACLQFPNGSSNVKVFDVVCQNGNGSAFAVDWTSCTNIMLGDPRNASGTALTPTGTPTNGSAFKYGLA